MRLILSSIISQFDMKIENYETIQSCDLSISISIFCQFGNIVEKAEHNEDEKHQKLDILQMLKFMAMLLLLL